MTHLERDTRVGRLRIRAAADDSLALAMRGEAVLRPLDLRPPGMARYATLCIRAMGDPLPGTIDLRTAHPPRPVEWERAARSVIAEAFRRAVRMGRRDAAVPADAEAVLFEDRAVLLATAARDAVHGRLDRWYWKKLLRATTLDAVLYEWHRDGTYVAAALELLGRDAVAFIRLLEPASVTALTATVTGFPRMRQLPPQWRAFAPVAEDETLNPEQRSLLAAALLLRRAPHLLRTGAESSQPLRAAARRSEEAATTRKLLVQQASAAAAHASTRKSAGRQAATDPQPRPASIPSQREPRRTAEPGNDTEPSQPYITPPSYPLRPARTRTIAATTSNEDAEQPLVTPAEQPAIREAIHSEHAGAFFLLNLVEWKFLPLVARMLVPTIEEDAVWEEVLNRTRAPRPQERTGEKPPAGRRGRQHRLPKAARAPLARTAVRAQTSAAGHAGPPEASRRFSLVGGMLATALRTLARTRRTLAAREVAPEMLVLQRGTIDITPAHLDVTYSLELHPLEIRKGGLDRDPGWIAAIGRHVAFHFD